MAMQVTGMSAMEAFPGRGNSGAALILQDVFTKHFKQKYQANTSRTSEYYFTSSMNINKCRYKS